MLMDVPSLDDTMPDNERLTRALRKYLNINRVRIPYVVLKKLPDVLRENNFAVKCVIRATSDQNDVYDIFGKMSEPLLPLGVIFSGRIDREKFGRDDNFCCTD